MPAPAVERRRYPDEAAFATGRQRMRNAGWLVRSIRRQQVDPGRGQGVDGTLEAPEAVGASDATSLDAAVTPLSGAAGSGAVVGGVLGVFAAAVTLGFFISRGPRRAPVDEIEVDYVPRRKRLRRRRPEHSEARGETP